MTHDVDFFLRAEGLDTATCGSYYWDPLFLPLTGDGRGATASGRGSGDDDDGARMLRLFRLIGPLMVVGLIIGLVIYCCKMKQSNASVSGSKNKSVELS